jgi:hypothetical protein
LITSLYLVIQTKTAKKAIAASEDIATLTMAAKTTMSVMDLRPALAAIAPYFAAQTKTARLVLIALATTALKGAETILSVLLVRLASVEFVSLGVQKTPTVTGLHPATLAASVSRHAALMPTAWRARYAPMDTASLGVGRMLIAQRVRSATTVDSV